MTRDAFNPATAGNALITAWLQFMLHDWIKHGTSPAENPWVLPEVAGDDWPAPPVVVMREMPDLTSPAGSALPPTHLRASNSGCVLAAAWELAGLTMPGPVRHGDTRNSVIRGGMRVAGRYPRKEPCAMSMEPTYFTAFKNLEFARCQALFCSVLQPSDAPTAAMMATAISRAVQQFGIRGCIARMAQEFGDHPDTAVERMRWARQLAARASARPQTA